MTNATVTIPRQAGYSVTASASELASPLPPPHQRLLVPDGVPVASQARRVLPRNKWR
jgi:hypothetical protein